MIGAQVLILPSSVLCSLHPGNPSPLHLQINCFLLRPLRVMTLVQTLRSYEEQREGKNSLKVHVYMSSTSDKICYSLFSPRTMSISKGHQRA